MGSVVDSNEAMYCEYILMVLHTTVSIIKGLVISSQIDTVSGDGSSNCVDCVIKKVLVDLLEEIICITEGIRERSGSEPDECRFVLAKWR